MPSLLLFLESDGGKVPVEVSSDALVGDLEKAAQEALGLQHAPAISFGGKELTDRKESLADAGFSSQATFSTIAELVVRVGDIGQQGADVRLPPAATVNDLRRKYLATVPVIGTVNFYVDAPGKSEPVPTFLPQWIGQKTALLGDTPLRDQGVVSGAKITVHVSTPGFRRGRPYVPDRTEIQTEMVPGSSCEVEQCNEGHGDGAQRRAAKLWMEQAAEEEASVASFAALTLRLMAHGAPAALVDASLVAGRDEIRHAAACRRFAAELGAEGANAASVLPSHQLEVTHGLAELAGRAVKEGAIGEATAAACATAAAAAADCAAVSAAQTDIAAEEARHAALAWATAAWAVRQPEGGDAVSVLAAAAEELERSVAEPLKQSAVLPAHREMLRFGHVEGGVRDAISRHVQVKLALPMLRALSTGAALPGPFESADPIDQTLNAVLVETAALVAAM